MTTKTATGVSADELADLFKRAAEAAKAADPGPEDGGTCNFDTPAFRIARGREATIMEAAEAAGVRVTDFTWLGGRRWYWLNVPMHGQGHRRTTMMEAAQKILDAHAEQFERFEAMGYYQMD